LGKDAPNLSPAVISRLTAEWQADYDAWQKRDLSARRYVYVWADGVYLQARMLSSIGAWTAVRPPAREGFRVTAVGPSITVVIFCWHILLISESMDHHDSEIMDDRSID
jgi:Transposase, Mutator family